MAPPSQPPIPGPNNLYQAGGETSPDSPNVPLAPTPTGSPNTSQPGLPFPSRQQSPQPLYSQPLGDDDGDITGLGGFPNAHFSRYSQASSMGGSGGGSITGMDRSASGMSMLIGDGESTNGLYAPVPSGAASRPNSGLAMQMSEFGSNDSPRGSYAATGLGSPSFNKEGGFEVSQAEKYAAGGGGRAPHGEELGAGVIAGGAVGGSFWARKKWWIMGAGGLAAIIVAVVVGVVVSKNMSKNGSTVTPVPEASSGSGAQSSSATAAQSSAAPSASAVVPKLAAFGTKGSKVIMADGTEGFEYENEFGGYWGWDAETPFNTSSAGRAQSWSPRLNDTFEYGVDRIRGVNLGGWLNTEPFIVPALYEKYYPEAVDEWTLSVAMGANLATEMEEHYKTFVTERDFMEIAAAGMNWVRIPIGFWAIETYDGEPFLEKVSWTYFLKAIEWSRKYGLRINLDLHAVPGSQNGWNHSGRFGLVQINLMRGQMGISNAQRTLNYIRTITEFISQPQYSDVVQMFGVLNEPFIPDIGAKPMESFYTEVYDVVRSITGVGEGKGPWITIHDGFNGVGSWAGFLANGDRVSLDTHTYFAFDDPHTGGLASFPAMACNSWEGYVGDSMSAFGLTNAGEWSFAINDCGEFLNGVGLGTRWEGNYTTWTTYVGSCENWNDSTDWSAETIQGFQDYALASMDALQNYFFWTWKIGNSTNFSYDVNPMWHYRLGLERGWAPKDPRAADGHCASLGVNNAFTGTLDAWNTGGAGAGLAVATRASWPPASFTNINAAQMTMIPQFVQTGTPITLPGPTYTSAGSTETYDAGNGWFNARDTAPAYVKVASCAYPDPWTDGTTAPTAGACGAGTVERMEGFAGSSPAKRTAIPEPRAPEPTRRRR